MGKPVAALIPARVEVAAKGGGYKWVDGYEVITPEGRETQPYMRKLEAKRYCRERGWAWVVKSRGEQLAKDFTDFTGFFTKGVK